MNGNSFYNYTMQIHAYDIITEYLRNVWTERIMGALLERNARNNYKMELDRLRIANIMLLLCCEGGSQHE